MNAKSIISMLSAVALSFAACGQGFTAGGPGGMQPGGASATGSYKYDGVVSVTTNADYTLSRDGTVYLYLSKNTAVTSGAAIDEIADGAFAGRTALKSVNLSASSLTNIPQNCFAGCTGLKIVVLPDTCTSISAGAFAGCTSLGTVIANGITAIGADAFRDCTALAIAPSTNDVSVGECAFANCPAITSMIRYNLDYDSDGGTVTTKSLYSTGVTTFTAKAKTGYLFAYWLDGDGNKIAFTASLSKSTAALDGTYTAVFRAKSECAAPSIVRSSAFLKGGSNLWNRVRGVRVSDRFQVPDECYPVKFTVKNLPTGLSMNATTGAITGIPTKTGTFNTVFTVTSRANSKKKSVTIPIKIVSLPIWACGKFTGEVVDASGETAAAKMTVTAAGKITGSCTLANTNWTFTATSFNAASVGIGDDRSFVGRATAKATYKVKSGSKTVTKTVTRSVGFTIVADAETSAIAAVTEDGYFGDGTLSFERDAGVKVTKSGETAGGTVTLSTSYGQVTSNATVKATAKLKSGYAFTGWYDADGNLLSKSLTYALTMLGSDVFLTASFTKESDLVRPTFSWNADTNLVVGVLYSAKPTVSGEAAVKIYSVTGLPTGLSWKSGKATGVPTVAKTYTAKVKVVLSTNTKKSWTYKVPLVVSALPAWAKGTFNGGSAGDDVQGLATFSVTAKGKISGKWVSGGTNWVMSASRYASYDASTSNYTANVALKYTYTKTVSGKKKSYTVSGGTVAVTVKPAEWAQAYSEETWSTAAGTATCDLFTASRNLWGLAAWKEFASEVLGSDGKTYVLEGESHGLLDGESVSILVKSTGAVTAVGKFLTGAYDSAGNATYYTPSCSTTLEAWGPPTADDFAGLIHVYFAPKASSGFDSGWAEAVSW